MPYRSIVAALVCAVVITAAPSLAASPKHHPATSAPAPEERRSVTHHRITVGGNAIAYTATAGTLTVKDKKGQPGASVFYVAYTQDGAAAQRRPLTFLYNGGPGAATVYLHMGALGPRRIVFPNAADSGGPAYQLVDNEYSLLDKSDLVFIDAPSTGYSRLLPKADPKDFFGIDQDAAAFGQFIDRYVTLNDRWNSPKFLLGESYGTPRSAVLVDYMQNTYNMAFNGVVLLSSVLDFDTLATGPGNDLPFVTYLPSEAATRWFHDTSAGKGTLEATVAAARDFANGAYASALMQGSRLPHDQFVQIAGRLAKITGLNERYIEQSNLRVPPGRFEKELMRETGRTVGRLDARYVGDDIDVINDSAEYDPADTSTSNAFQSMFMAYSRNELNWRAGDETYKQINGDTNQNWDYTRKSVFGWLAPTTSADLQEAMTSNTRLHVMVGAGYYDLATPIGAAEWTFSHIPLSAAARSRISFEYYESGHMVYLNPASLAKFHGDLDRFYDRATAK